SEGEIFSTKTGSLKLIVDRKHPTVWVQAGKTTRLREVPVGSNLPMIYSDLGVYASERMGTPCDELQPRCDKLPQPARQSTAFLPAAICHVISFSIGSA